MTAKQFIERLKALSSKQAAKGHAHLAADKTDAIIGVSRMGFEPVPLGRVVENGSGRYLAFSCDVLRPDCAHGAPPGMLATSKELNIGLVRQLHLGEDETILGTTYEWSQSGKRVTVWHETDGKTAARVVDIPVP